MDLPWVAGPAPEAPLPDEEPTLRTMGGNLPYSEGVLYIVLPRGSLSTKVTMGLDGHGPVSIGSSTEPVPEVEMVAKVVPRPSGLKEMNLPSVSLWLATERSLT